MLSRYEDQQKNMTEVIERYGALQSGAADMLGHATRRRAWQSRCRMTRARQAIRPPSPVGDQGCGRALIIALDGHSSKTGAVGARVLVRLANFRQCVQHAFLVMYGASGRVSDRTDSNAETGKSPTKECRSPCRLRPVRLRSRVEHEALSPWAPISPIETPRILLSTLALL